MAKVIFYPVGNGDCTLIQFSDGRLLLEDFSYQESDDGRPDLVEEIGSFLAEVESDHFDVVAFSHADSDHVKGAEEFFWFEHSPKYQDSDRIRIREIHLPANFLLEANLEGSALAIRDEGRHRLKAGHGIRIYGEPESLNDFLEDAGIEPSSRTQLITRAGNTVPGFSRDEGQAEIFVHSPFTYKVEDEPEPRIRNGNSIIWQISFFEGESSCKMMLGADADHQSWADIFNISMSHDNADKLVYDLFRVSHHCSYTALAEDKGTDITEPRSEVVELFEFGNHNCYLISSSLPIPLSDTDEPPHRQAANYYKSVAESKGERSNFVVTMEWPSDKTCRPMIFSIGPGCFSLDKSRAALGGIATVTRRPSPRMGTNA